MRSALLALACALATPAAWPGEATDETITLNLDGVPLAKVLEMFAVEHHLNVVAGSDVSGTVTVNLYQVPAEEALRKVLEVNGYGFERDGSFYIVRKLDAMESATDDPIETAVVWLDYVPADEALKLVAPLKSELGVFTAGSRAAQGLSSDGNDAGGNSLAAGEVIVLKDRRSIVEHVRGVLVELDRKPRQVRIEATILEVKLTDETQLGIDFNTLSGIKFTDAGATSNFNDIVTKPISGDAIEDGLGALGTAGFASNTNTDGLHLGYITDSVSVFVDAIERVTDATVLANPRLLVVDRQRAEIIIGAKLGYQTSTTTETATVQQIEFLDIGTQLRFRPFIASDGTVRMEIHPENSTGVVDPISGLPSETTTEVTTNILVKDGYTIAIGGLIGDQVEKTTKQVPFLGSIPYLGVLFRQTVDKVSRREVIVLLTPHVIDPERVDEEQIAIGDSMANNRDLILRAHLPLSRMKLATRWIDCAERALRDGDAEAVLRYSDAALFLVPSDVRASTLRRRALAVLELPNDEIRALEALSGLR